MLDSKIIYQGRFFSIRSFIKNYGITIIKPPEDTCIEMEYAKLEEYFTSCCRALLNYLPSKEALEQYTLYKDSLFAQGEKAIDLMLLGPPPDEIAVLLNKFSNVLQEDTEASTYLFPLYEIAKLLKEE